MLTSVGLLYCFTVESSKTKLKVYASVLIW